VSAIRFATDQRHGWIYGPELWATTDGGGIWKRVTLPSSARGPVNELEVGRGQVHAVVLTEGSVFRIVSAAVGSSTWTVATVQLHAGAGPVPSVQLVLGGDGGWVLQNDRTVVNGARLVGGEWQPWSPVCADAIGPAYLAAASSTDLAAACDVGAWATPKGTHLFTSADGGDQWHEATTAVPVSATQAIATPDGTNVFVAGSTAASNVIEATADQGKTWRMALDLETGQATDLGFTTQTQGVVIAVHSDGSPNQLFMTRDTGRTWAPVTF
jgi:photosystem II stability/assembly factor-like uncharacterized protein